VQCGVGRVKSDGMSVGREENTFEAWSCGQGVHVGGAESGPGVVGGREGEAVGWVEC